MFREAVVRAFSKKNKFSVKQLLLNLKDYIGWIFVLAACLGVSLMVCSQIGVWTLSPIISNGYEAFKGLEHMTVMSYFDGSFFRVVSGFDEQQIVHVSTMLMLFMLVAYLLFIGIYVGRELSKARKSNRSLISKPTAWQATNFSLCLLLIAMVNTVAEIAILFIMPHMQGASEELNAANLLSTSGGPFFTIMCAGILAPIVEEILFRKHFQKAISYFNPKVSLVVTSILFGVMHGNLLQILFATVMGFVLGFVYEITDNILYPIGMHILVNITGCIISIAGFNEYCAYPIAVFFPLALCFLVTIRNQTIKMEVKL